MDDVIDIEDDIECAEDYADRWLDDKSFEIRGVEVIGKADAKELSDWLIDQLKDMAKIVEQEAECDTARNADGCSYIPVKELMELQELYGEYATIRDIIKHDAGSYPLYKCPECEGNGIIYVEDPYTGMDTDNWFYCAFCGGHGYVTKKYKPKMVKKEYTEQEEWSKESREWKRYTDALPPEAWI